MIKIFLLFGLLVCIAYAFLQRKKSHLVSWGIVMLCLAGMVLVIEPDIATASANLLGIGRGVDLILYFWILFSVFVMMNLQFKIFSLQRTLTELSREVSIRTARTPGNGG